MTWDAAGRTVAQPTIATVGGTSIAAGAQVHIDLSFGMVEWPWEEKGPVSLVPQPSEVTARTDRGELSLGFAIPAPASVLTPAEHSSTGIIRFTLSLSTLALVELEATRNGGALTLIMQLVAHPLFITRSQEYSPGINIYPTSVSFPFKVPKEEWIALLKSVGYCDTLVTELRLPTSGPESTAKGRKRLAHAVSARNDGSYAEAMRRCRTALDELKNAGFGGKAPADVAKFLQEKAGTMLPVERFSVLQVALQLFLSPAHHANAPDEHYTREDAELAIAMTAALLRLAPQHADRRRTASDARAASSRRQPSRVSGGRSMEPKKREG
ncbi:MAG: hypothetical protein SFV15_20360 [Polyangiaceae bacterium]|nr:hypothetical protein [Polyangiaceae bacterium]